MLALPCAEGQFHSKKPGGQTGLNPQAVNSAQQQAATMPGVPSAARAGAASAGASAGVPGSPPVTGGGVGGGDMILPDGTRQALSQWNVRLGQMQGKPIDIWGRAIHHSDGTFTESKQDLVTNTLEQITKSKNGVRLQRRMIMLDDLGRPAEVLIYDGREQFKYRGLQVYDGLGRFTEEQLYDSQGTLIRRKIQEYDPVGQKLPLRSVDYVANVPEDLKLVITRDDDPVAGAPNGTSSPAGTPQKEAAPRKGFNFGRPFGGKKRE